MKIKSITKAVIPVAGLGTRFLPASKVVPKELFPLLYKPVIQHIVEELVEAGIKDIIFVVNKDKRSIQHHFSEHKVLENMLMKREKHDLLHQVKRISRLAKFHFVEQKTPHGDGHALLSAEKLLKGKPCIVIFGDTIFDAKPTMSAQLLKAYEKSPGNIIAVSEVKSNETNQYGIVGQSVKTTLFEATKLVEKPQPKDAPSNLAIIGAYIVTPEAFAALKKKPSSVENEIRLIDGLRGVMKRKPVYGLIMKGTWLDTGTYFGFLKASIHLSLQNKAISKPLKAYLNTLDL